jgi:predicted MFS family arabinose efflux permease
MISQAAAAVGRGKGFAVHETLDQTGAVAGPLLVAAVLAVTAGDYRLGFGMLAIPAAAVIGLLWWLRTRVPDPARFEPDPPPHPHPTGEATAARPARLPPEFWTYLIFTMLTTTGYATFGVLAFHLADTHVFPVAAIPLLYAAAMGIDAAAALASGWWYDRAGRRVLAAVPVLSAAVPVLVFTTTPALALVGVLAWGAVAGVQESTMRAAVADLVPATRRGTAYGVFAAGFGTAAAAGGLLAGILYDHSIPALVATTMVIQAIALAWQLATGSKQHRPA